MTTSASIDWIIHYTWIEVVRINLSMVSSSKATPMVEIVFGGVVYGLAEVSLP